MVHISQTHEFTQSQPARPGPDLRASRCGRTVWAAALFCLLAGCADDPLPVAELPRARDMGFSDIIHPVLLRDCGFPACHGNPQRFFRVWGPGRMRLPNRDGTTPAAFDTATIDEVAASFAVARGMVDIIDPQRSPLLQKPLAVSAGGAGHEGVDRFGRDVYRTTRDSEYLLLSEWVRNVTEAETPAPVQPGGQAAGGATPPAP